MQPLDDFLQLAQRAFEVGRVYRLVEMEQRSVASHKQFFAAVHEAWQNLPEALADRFPTDHHLRKWALIKAGFHIQTTFVVPSHAEALRTARALEKVDDFIVVLVDGNTVTHYRAKSQSFPAMGKAEFQRSKDGVFKVLAELIDVQPEQLKAIR